MSEEVKRTRIMFETDIDYQKYHNEDLNIFELIEKTIDQLDIANNTKMYLVDCSLEDEIEDDEESCEYTTCIAETCENIRGICRRCHEVDCHLSNEYDLYNDDNQMKF